MEREAEIKTDGVRVFQKGNVKVEYKAGDIYEKAREDYAAGETEAWHCPFDDISLKEIYKENIEDLEEDDERYVKFLMDRYHCDAKETRIGVYAHKALEGINRVKANLEAGKPPYGEAPASIAGGLLGKLKARGGGGGDAEEDKEDEAKKKKEQEEEDDAGDSSHKVFGSWHVVHPAAIGRKAQTVNFNPAEFDDLVDHPASFQYFQAPPEVAEEESVGVNPIDIVKGHPEHAKWMTKETLTNCKVVSSMEELAKVDYGKVRKGLQVLFTTGKTQELVNETEQSLESRQVSATLSLYMGGD